MNFRIPPRRPSRPLRVVIVGAGLMGFWHGRTARDLGARVVAVVDPDPSRAAALARALRIGVTATDPSEVLQRDNVDAVHICSPAGSHGALARLAIEGGIHALIEKPLVETVTETRSLLEEAARKAVVLCPVHQVAFQDGVARGARALGELGDVSLIEFRICSAGGRGRSEAELDAVLADVLPHPLSVLRRLWPAASIAPESWSVNRTRPGEFLICGVHAGALLSIVVSLHARPTRFEMDVAASRGSLHLDFFHGFCVAHRGQTSRLNKAARPFTTALKLFGSAAVNALARGLHREMAYPGLRSLTRAFYAAARGEAAAPISAIDIVAVAEAREEILLRLRPNMPRIEGAVPIAWESSAE